MSLICHHPELEPLVLEGRLETWPQVRDRLDSWGTLELQPGPHGLFEAVSGGGRNRHSGYESVWLRDNVHVAHSLWRSGDPATARQTLNSLLEYQLGHIHRFENAIAGRTDLDDPMQRPHVRFSAETLSEKSERWAHAQNDALAYVLWLAARMWGEGAWRPSTRELDSFAKQVAYFRVLPYYEDRDSGHWEEERALKSSSIGTVVAALESLAETLEREGPSTIGTDPVRENVDSIRALGEKGRRKLEGLLPAETADEREADAALLFLIEPLGILSGEQERSVADLVYRDLLAAHGIKRYIGDSYWCGDYRELVAPQRRSSDYADSTAGRDRLLQPGEEAQWCIFDPVLSAHYGRRYRAEGDAAHHRRQLFHLRRSLGQITGPTEWCEAGLCPEAYFLASRAEGRYRPNDQTPLAWTQAALRWAILEFERTRA